ncbi:hypothetical protein IMZ48_13825 [Candidatus Bathyarchaeota archaeon]|nr:hypothetical protein [Candidatus Bathyarchaeota archaeon]
MNTDTPMAPLVVQNWIPAGQTGAVVTHSPSTQLDLPTYHPALRLRKGETWRDVASLGKGAFGSVMLQQCLEPATGTARPLRAVKKIVEPRCCPHNVSRHWERVENEIRANSILSKVGAPRRL